MGAGDVFKEWQYHSDDGTTYQVKLSANTASQGGFTQAAGSEPIWPYGNHNMRHVRGLATDGSGKREGCPINSPSNAKFVTLGSSIHNSQTGKDYKIESSIGERRDSRNF